MKTKFVKFLVFSVLLTLCWHFAPAQTPDPIDSTKVTMGVVYNDVKGALSQIGAALKVGAEHVYGVLVKQQVVEAVTWLIVLVFFFTLSSIFWIIWYKLINDNTYDEEGFVSVPIILSIITIVIFVLTINTVVGGFINPEYGAMKEIMHMIGGRGGCN